MRNQLNAINDRGQAVGAACIAGRDYSLAIVTNMAGTSLYLLESRLHQRGLQLELSEAINDHGRILADGVDGHCYVLVPD